ncbi:MAG: AAA family ATPase [Cyanobacteria bacterium SBLK]|nr:AAA family ATPase [Cyanobacteria bacterium SBLK]
MNGLDFQIDKYRESELIYESDRTVVYRARYEENGQSVIIKLMRNEYPSFQELVQFRNQYAIGKNLEIEGIVKPYALERYKNRYALIMEDAGSISLAEYKYKYPLSLGQFLDIAIQLADILHQLHQNHIIHKDIKPANILVRPDTQQIKLIDFSISTRLPKETQCLQTPNVLEGTLAYLSPEQTGRMNRGIDYRSDFYSLGVTFYELLVGNVPFSSDDPLELIYAHIAQNPEPVSRWVGLEGKLCPELLSNIVLKLMAKNAENRYQSALGLKYDLERCRIQYRETQKIEPFVLGERDICDRFLIPEKLYGREEEVKTLLAAFERVSGASGASGALEESCLPTPPSSLASPAPPPPSAELLLVAGFSGIGKTAIINEVHKPIARQRGYFIKGKFDQFNRNIPFSGFIQAFRDLMGQLLGESDAKLSRWKAKILEAVGENGQVLIDVIPELQRIIGVQPPVPELSGSAIQNRFNLLFEKFIAVFTTQEHPLTLFIDDLQWADSASLNLMKVLMGDARREYLLLLGAYRDNEVFPTHPLMLSLAELEKQCNPSTPLVQSVPPLSTGGSQEGSERESREQNTTISTITLTPLSVAHINQLVAETLSCTVDLATPLTDLVYQKTKGNPFFTTQFLKGLYRDGFIAFKRNLGYWECDLTKVRDAALTDDVVEFMSRYLSGLPEATQQILKFAACIGNQFDLETLAIICEIPTEKVAANLWSTLREGLILPQSQAYKFFQEWKRENGQEEEISVSYRFLHDRVQQAAYSLIDETLKPETHLKLGRLLLKELSDRAIEENIFEVINQLNLGHFLIEDRQEKDELARLNLLAGRRAKISTAYLASVNYLELGIELLDNNWEYKYDLIFSLYLELIESEYINTNFERSKALADIALECVRSTLDRLKINELQIQYYITKNERKEAVDLGLNSLELLNIQLNRTAPNISDIEALVNLPEMIEPSQIIALRILIATVSAAVIAAPDLLISIAFTMVGICIRFGNSYLSPYAYGFYAWMLCSFLEEIDRGYRFGKLAMQLLDKFDTKIIKCKVYQQFNVFVRHYKEPLKNMTALVEAVQSGLETGDIEYACYSAQDYCIVQFFLGQNLRLSLEKQKKYLDLIQQKQQEFSFHFTSPWLQLVSNLLTNSLDRLQTSISLNGEFFDERERIAKLQQDNDNISLFPIFFIKLYLNYLFSDYETAVKNGVEAEKVKAGSRGFIYYPTYLFYHSLALLATYLSANTREREIIIDRVNSQQKQLEFWIENAPFTYQHKYDLVQAECCRLLDRKIEAINLYDRAIAGAKENDYIQEEALANELAAKFYLDWDFGSAQSKGKEKFAALHMRESYYCYAQWGAEAKTNDLEERYPQLLKPILQCERITPSSKTTSRAHTQMAKISHISSALDFSSLLKTSQIPSQEIELEHPISTLMKIILENAGATKGALLLTGETGLTVEAIATRTHPDKPLQLDSPSRSIPLEDYPDLPVGLINTVRRTAETALFDAKTAQAQFAADRYFLHFSPQSLLCLPLLEGGNLIGVLYLENYLSADAFTSDRVKLLDILCVQATISLNNARLYQQAQQALKDLQNAQLQLVQNEKMATLGNLVAGVAREINNPLGFISGNIAVIQDYLNDLYTLIEGYREELPQPSPQLAENIEELDLDFLLEDFPKIIASMQEGCDRIANISTSLRTFSRTDADQKTEFNLHEGLDSTLLILKYRLKANKQRPAIKIVNHYSDIPEVKCYPGQLNQVFMNLLANAIDAIDESNESKTFAEIEKASNRIIITTELSKDRKTIVVKIADNGKGMSEEVKAKIFEQGFTTKEVSKGTGLGMAIAKSIIEEKHGGAIICRSEVGKGTEFEISFPVV